MSQEYNAYSLIPYYFVAKNLDIFVSNTETIVLDNVYCGAVTTFALTIKNKNSSGKITNVSVYGTPNDVDYFIVNNDLFPNGITHNNIDHTEFYALVGKMRVTVTTDTSELNLDVYLRGTTT